MESKAMGFCAVVVVLGIISTAAGFAGEATRIKASDVYIEGDLCSYPSSPASAFGLTATVFAIILRIYLSVTFGRCSCCRSDPDSTPISTLIYVLSWVASVIGVALLLAAAVLNNEESGEVDSYGYVTCYVVKPGIFAAGAVFTFLSAILGIAAFVNSTSSAITNPAEDANTVDLEKSPHQHSPQ